jgi:superoxide dismutase, Cu-Zn family
MTRRRKVLAAMLSCAFAGSAALAASAPQPDAAQTGPAGKATARAHATLAGEGVSGTVEFVEMAYDTGNEVEITLTAKGLKPGLHGVHLHAVGKCEPPAFTAAGGHFDPGPAGNTDPDANHPFHMGDIPNLRVGADGSGTLQARTTRVTLSEGPLSLFDGDGSAVIVHGNPDQGTTGEPKSGVSGGPRVACGVIEKK